MTPNFGSHGTDACCEARPEVEENSPRRTRRMEAGVKTGLLMDFNVAWGVYRLLHPPGLRTGPSASSSSFVLFVSFVVKQCNEANECSIEDSVNLCLIKDLFLLPPHLRFLRNARSIPRSVAASSRSFLISLATAFWSFTSIDPLVSDLSSLAIVRSIVRLGSKAQAVQ